jgi:hypothetical protein
MTFTAQTFRVLIASPSDLVEERQVATDVINDWNAQHAVAESVVLLPIKWETHAKPETGKRPQKVLNSQLVATSDILVGMFWTRIGTPTGAAESGTVEEIDQFVAAGKPAQLYFSRRLIDPTKIDHKQHKKLRAFKEDTYEHALTGEFATIEELRHRLMKNLTAEVRKLKAAPPRPEKPFKSYGIAVTSPKPGAQVPAPVDLSGTIKKPLPVGSELWLFTTGRSGDDNAFWAQDAVRRSGKTWTIRYTPRDFKPGDRRSLQLFVVGPDGQALISYFKRVNRHFAAPSGKPWVGISKLTADMIAVSDPFDLTLSNSDRTP